MISKTFAKYFWLMDILYPKFKRTFKEINIKWKYCPLYDGKPIPLRTFHMHRKAIEEMFGVIITCESSGQYRYYISNPEILEISHSKKWVLNRYNIPKEFYTYKMMEDKILLEEMANGWEYLDFMIEAIEEKEELKIDYQPFEGDRKTVHFHPYSLKAYNRKWYIVGHSVEANEIRCIALDRIYPAGIVKSTVKFDVPVDFDAKKYFANTVGIHVKEGEKPTNVRIRVYGLQVEYIRSCPLHHSQNEITSKYKEYSDFQYRLCITPDLENCLLSMGENVEVLEPIDFREKIKSRIEASLNKYRQ